MSEQEKVPPYTSPPPYNPHEFPATGFQGPQHIGFQNPHSSSYPVIQPSGYPAPGPQAPIVVPTTTIIQTAGFGENPRQTVCPNCRSTIMTRVRTEVSNCQHLVCCLMFITVGCTLCSCLPYCCDGCANIRHECPRCGTHLGSYTR